MKNIVNQKQSAKLKKLGFNLPCDYFYEIALNSKKDKENEYFGPFGWKKGECYLQKQYFINNTISDYSNKNWFISSAPHIEDDFDWFLENHNLDWERQFKDGKLILLVGKYSYHDNSLDFFKSIDNITSYEEYQKVIKQAKSDVLDRMIEILESRK